MGAVEITALGANKKEESYDSNNHVATGAAITGWDLVKIAVQGPGLRLLRRQERWHRQDAARSQTGRCP